MKIMSEENRLIIEQLNKFGRVLQTSELLKMIEDLEKEKTMYKTSFEEMSKNYFEIQQEYEQLKKELNTLKMSEEQWLEETIGHE